MNEQPTPSEPSREFMTTKQLSDWLGVSVRSVANLRRRGILPHIKIRRIILYRRVHVIQALEKFRRN